VCARAERRGHKRSAASECWGGGEEGEEGVRGERGGRGHPLLSRKVPVVR
jgi:hypothetical protein